MHRRMMKSKIHRMTVTDANVDYVGSITLDPDLLGLADIREWEQVAVVDVDNGARFETYVILGQPGAGDCCLNGAAARLVEPGHKVIVISYADYDDAELESYEPAIVHVDQWNRPITLQDAQDQVALGSSAHGRPNVASLGDLHIRFSRFLPPQGAEPGDDASTPETCLSGDADREDVARTSEELTPR